MSLPGVLSDWRDTLVVAPTLRGLAGEALRRLVNDAGNDPSDAFAGARVGLSRPFSPGGAGPAAGSPKIAGCTNWHRLCGATGT